MCGASAQEKHANGGMGIGGSADSDAQSHWRWLDKTLTLMLPSIGMWFREQS